MQTILTLTDLAGAATVLTVAAVAVRVAAGMAVLAGRALTRRVTA